MWKLLVVGEFEGEESGVKGVKILYKKGFSGLVRGSHTRSGCQ